MRPVTFLAALLSAAFLAAADAPKLSTSAAAIQTYAGLRAIPAWELAGKMPESVQVAVRDAAAGGIRSLAERQVRAVLDAWATTRTAAQPVEYPSFSEEVACTRRPALE
jgi:hypothetical protein